MEAGVQLSPLAMGIGAEHLQLKCVGTRSPTWSLARWVLLVTL